MGSISQEIKLVDKVSPNLTKIQENALKLAKEYQRLEKEQDDVWKSMENLEKVGLAGTKTYRDLADVYFALEAEMKNIANGNYKIVDSQDHAQQSANKLAMSMTELNQTLEVAKKAWGMVQQATQEAYKWMNIYNEDFNSKFIAGNAMHTLLGYSGSDIQGMFNYASELQSKGVVSDEAIISGMQELSKHARGTTQQSLKNLTKLTVDLAVSENGLNTSMSNVNSTASMLGRALEGQTETLRRTYGLTEAEVKSFKELSNQGQKVDKLVQVMSKHVGNLNEELADTAQGGLLQTRNEMNELYETLGEKVTPYIAAFEEAVYQLLKPALEWVADNMDWIAPTFLVLAAVIGVVIVAITALSIANFIAGASWLASLWPILLVIAALIAVVAVVVIVSKKILEEQGKQITTIQILGALFGKLVSEIQMGLIILWNSIAGFANFFANVFDNPIASIEIKFLDFINFIAGQLRGLAQLIDTIFGTGITAAVDKGIDSINKTRANIIEESGYKEVMQMKSYQEVNVNQSMQDWMKTFGDLENSINKAFENNDLFSKLEGMIVPDDSGSDALKITSSDNLLGEEEIQLLLDIATRDFKLEYQQITPEVTITFGDVHETADVDSITEAIVTQLEEVYDSDLMEVAPA